MSLPNEWQQRQLRKITLRPATWNPRNGKRDRIRYVDVSGVDRETLRIVAETPYSAADAPSRARKIVQAGDTIFATVRPTLRRIAQVPASLDGEIVSTAFCVLRPDPDQLDADFLFFATQLESVMFGISALETGASYPAVRDSDVLDQVIPVPPLTEQQEIASVLNVTRSALLHEFECEADAALLKRAAMRTLFTRGLRGQAQKETEIGPVPESWDTPTVAESVRPFRFDRGKQITTSAYGDTGRWPIIDQGQQEIAGYTDTVEKVITPDQPIIIFGDHTRVFKFVDFPFALGADGTKPLLAGGGFEPKFLFHALTALDVPSRGYNRHYTVLSEMRLPKPASDEQREIVAILDAIDRKIDLHKRKRAVLDELFKALLHKLITGGIRVADLDLSALAQAKELEAAE